MKKKFDLWVHQSPTLKKLIMELKIAILIVVIGISNAIATPTYSQVAKVSLEMQNSTLERVMDENEELQQRKITGTVNDEKGNPLPGVSVMVKGTTEGTVTSIDGNYELAIPESAGTLVFSFIGMETQEVAIGSSNAYNVTLFESFIGLDEVIVIGYGTAKKSDLTGSVTRVKPEDYQTQALVQVSDMLTGTVAGFNASQSTSAAGGSSMEIRGPTSLSAGTSPLIVLDGVIYPGNLRDINPKDIESVDILKDASSSAIFGAKAANGVVIITTTKGSLGPPTINFSSTIGFVDAANKWQPYDGEGYLKARGDYLDGEANYTLPRNYYTHPHRLPDGLTIEDWKNFSASPNDDEVVEYLNRHRLFALEVNQYLAGEEVNWYDMVVTGGVRQDYDLSIRGGTENHKYYWSVGYIDNEGLIKGDKFSAIRSRLNADFKIRDWLDAGVNAQYSLRDESVVQANLGRAYLCSPFGKDRNEDGTLNLLAHEVPGMYHPLMEYYGTDRLRKINSLFSVLYAQLNLPLGISYRLSFQPRSSFTKDYQFHGDQTELGFASHVGGYATRDESESFGWILDNLVKWNREVGIHNFDVTLLASLEQNKAWSTSLNNQTFTPNLKLGYNALQYGSKPVISNYDSESTGDALMARLNYTILGKYFFTASARRDGYSAFGQENPRATFPSLAFAWQVDKENFYNIDLINRLKLRLSWGVNGNRDIGIYSAMANLGNTRWYDGSKVIIGVYNSTLANTGLRWERTEASNIGLDIGLFENRFDLSIDYYDMLTTDMLMSRNLPQITGFKSIMANLGELKNRGLEMTLNTVNIQRVNFNWRSNLVFSFNRNKINKLFGDTGKYTLMGEENEGELPDFTNRWFPGRAVDVVWNYNILGVWQIDEADEAARYKLQPGDYKAEDLNEDGRYVELHDKQFLGYTKPRYRIGLRNDFEFLKNFAASLFIRADLGHINYLPQALPSGGGSMDRYNLGPPLTTYWTPDNQVNEYPRLDTRARIGAYGGGLLIYFPMSFVRIQDLSISYTLPDEITQRMAMNSMRIYGSIRNLFCLTKWPGYDPESGYSHMPRTFSIGIDIAL